MNPSLHHKSPLHNLLSSCIQYAMSQGANLPQEVERSHDLATSPHGSIPTGLGSLTVTVTPADAGSSEHAISAVLSTGECSNAASEIIASPMVPPAGEDNIKPKIASPTEFLAEENKDEFKLGSPAVILADEEKISNALGSKLASPAMPHDCDNSKARSHAGMDNNNTTQSKLTSRVVLHVVDGNNGGSKITNSALPQAIMDNTSSSMLDSRVHHASKDKNSGYTLPNPAVLHANKDKYNNAERPNMIANPLMFRAGKDHKARTKLTIQTVSRAGGNAGSSRLTRSAALLTAKDDASKLAIQVVSHPVASKDNNAGLSKAAARPAAVNAGESNAAGKNNIAGEERAHEANVGSGSGKGNAALVLDMDHNLHIFTERERRKKMKNMFSTLHALLPQLPNKADKTTIVGETVIYIKALERTAEKLEKLKLERKRALVGAGSSCAASSTCHPTPALQTLVPPLPSSREVNLADMVHGWQAQQAVMATANKALATAAAAAKAMAGGTSSSAPALPRGAVPFPAPAAGFQTWSGQNLVVSMANNEAYINLRTVRQPGTLTKALFVLERHHIEVITTTISTQDGFRMYGIHARANPASAASARFPENLCAEDRFKLAVSEMLQLLNI